MLEKAGIEKIIEDRKTIKTFKKFLQEKRFTIKAIKKYRKQMSLHHLKHKSEGGKTTLENSAILSSLAHMYLHSLPRQQEEFINDELRKFKQTGKCRVVFVEDLDLPYEIKPMEFSIEEKRRYNRAKEKEELRKAREEYR